MSQNNPLPYVGATMVYKAANGGENINGHDDLACIVTKLNYTGAVLTGINVVIIPDTGGALVAKNGVSFVAHSDHAKAAAGSVHWPQPQFV